MPIINIYLKLIKVLYTVGKIKNKYLGTFKIMLSNITKCNNNNYYYTCIIYNTIFGKSIQTIGICKLIEISFYVSSKL